MSDARATSEPPPFIEVDWFNRHKFRKVCSGDVFLSERLPDGSVVAVLTDGLGSGQQANVCASLTATMAMAYMRASPPKWSTKTGPASASTSPSP